LLGIGAASQGHSTNFFARMQLGAYAQVGVGAWSILRERWLYRAKANGRNRAEHARAQPVVRLDSVRLRPPDKTTSTSAGAFAGRKKGRGLRRAPEQIS
jgi:hypothetical protein